MEPNSDERFLRDIEAFLAETGMSATAFGKAVTGDARFLRDLRQGRSVSLRIYDRVTAFMAAARRFGEARADTGAPLDIAAASARMGFNVLPAE